jgi:SAM-dependent methyltransferase
MVTRARRNIDFLFLLKHFFGFYLAAKAMIHQPVLPTRVHLRLGADWLLKAQKNSPDAGYSRLYCLYSGWDQSYIETTGYIIPTLFDVATYLNDRRFSDSALNAGQWLLSMQQISGAFTDIDLHAPQAFDTGQVITGLICLFERTGDDRYAAAARRAANWLAKVQDEDGSWTTFGYLKRPHAYYSKVSAALLHLSEVTGISEYADSAHKNLDWTLAQQRENGFFRYSEFAQGECPFLHTIIYTLEGLFLASQITKEPIYIQAALKSAERLKSINLTRDLILYSQYDDHWKPMNKEKCTAGLAQWAWLCLQIYQTTNDLDYLHLATRTIYYLKSKQIRTKGKLEGALPGSVPFWGRYGRMKFMNWNIKYFLDALLSWAKLGKETWQEQETWVSSCFSFSSHLVGEHLSQTDYLYLRAVERILASRKRSRVTYLDLGCGKGKHLKNVKKRYPQWSVIGIDPIFKCSDLNIRRGSAYSIPLASDSVDIVVCFEVLQHIADLARVLEEIRRVLRKPGALFIADRCPLSGLGLLKPFMEFSGKWMYPWDSPFRERWYSSTEWRRMLSAKGFSVESIKTVGSPCSTIDRGLHRYYLIHCSY